MPGTEHSEDIDYLDYLNKHKQKIRAKALNKIADYLARRDHSILELKQKLQKHFEPEDIEWALKEAKNRNWLSNEDEISERAAESLHNKNKGYLYIISYLRQKGLPEVSYDYDREIKKATNILLSKFGSTQICYEEKQKAFRLLKNRGFEDCLIRSLIF